MQANQSQRLRDVSGYTGRWGIEEAGLYASEKLASYEMAFKELGLKRESECCRCCCCCCCSMAGWADVFSATMQEHHQSLGFAFSSYATMPRRYSSYGPYHYTAKIGRIEVELLNSCYSFACYHFVHIRQIFRSEERGYNLIFGITCYHLCSRKNHRPPPHSF